MKEVSDEKAGEDAWGKKIICFAVALSFIFLPLSVVFLWQESFSISDTINDGKFGTFGDFFGGVIGAIWSLCGMILFYLALKEQRRDFKNNNRALIKQIEAMEIQGKEFQLQRNEMELARKVSREQSDTLQRQRLDGIYFSLIELYKKTLVDLNCSSDSGNYFKSLREEFFNLDVLIGHPKENHSSSKLRYLNIYFLHKEELSYYFKTIYRVIKVVDQARINEVEKFRYVKILRSQLSESELLALYYNSHSEFGGDLYKMVLEYNLLKHLSCVSKIEFSQYLQSPLNFTQEKGVEVDVSEKSSYLHRFSVEIKKILGKFQRVLEQEVNKDGFDEVRVSMPIPFSEDYVVSLQSCECNELKISIFRKDGGVVESFSGLEKLKFERFFCEFLYDAYWFSQYIRFDIEEALVSVGGDEFKMTFDLKSHKKLLLNFDME